MGRGPLRLCGSAGRYWLLIAVAALQLPLLVGCRDCMPQPGGAGEKAGHSRQVALATPDGNVRARKDAMADDVCAELRARFEATRDEAGNRCGTDGDCACYSPLIDCGGAADSATVARLHTIVRMYRAARCPARSACPPLACHPVCVNGHCVRSASAANFVLPTVR